MSEIVIDEIGKLATLLLANLKNIKRKKGENGCLLVDG